MVLKSREIIFLKKIHYIYYFLNHIAFYFVQFSRLETDLFEMFNQNQSIWKYYFRFFEINLDMRKITRAYENLRTNGA